MDADNRPKRPRITLNNDAKSVSRDGNGYNSERATYRSNDNRDSRPRRDYNNEGNADNNREGRYENRSYNQGSNNYGERKQYGNRSFDNNRSYNREGGYQQREGGFQQRENRYQGNREGGFQQREGGYQQRENRYQGTREGGYQQRENRYQGNREGGFQQREGGYQQRENRFQGNREGGFQQRENRFQGNREGGFQQRENRFQGNREGGFQQRENRFQGNREGGFQQRENRFQGNREGGFQQRSNSRYGNSQPGNFQPRSSQSGAFSNNRFGGNNFRKNDNNYDPNAKYSKKKQMEYADILTDPNEPIRLNKYIANAGLCSRREADEFIAAGMVKVNGEVVTELGTKVSRTDAVSFNEKEVTPEGKVYVLLNKPKDCVTTSDDPQERLTVLDLVKNACDERIYPVGRLDRNTTGVLLLTNDGDLASKLTHPKYNKKKIYHVWLDKDVTMEDIKLIATGIELEDGEIHADAISYADEDDQKQIGIEIHSGRNRIVRRIFEHLGYRVIKLDRVMFAGLTKKNLPRGRWRHLTQEEVNFLRMGSFE
ncbi:MAG: pseudouridine synthase [Bacteroidales bacterium]